MRSMYKSIAAVLEQLNCQLSVESVEKTLPNTEPPEAPSNG
jgi:hypothetical protein